MGGCRGGKCPTTLRHCPPCGPQVPVRIRRAGFGPSPKTFQPSALESSKALALALSLAFSLVLFLIASHLQLLY